MNNKNWFYLLGLILLFFSLAFITGCVREKKQETEERVGVPVEVSEVQTRTLEETVQAIGSLEPEEKVVLRPEIAGRIVQINFTEGDRVEAGQMLYQIEAKKLHHQYLSVRSTLKGARAKLANVRKKYNRYKQLFKRGLASKQRLDDLKEALKSARSRVDQLNQQLQQSRESYQDAKIHAPFTGRAGAIEVDTGNYVSPGDPLASLYKHTRLEAAFTVPEKYIGEIETGQNVRVTVPAHPGITFPGTVTFVSPRITEQSRDLLVKARIKNSTHALKPGGFCQVELVTEVRENRPVIPPEAMVPTRTGYLVFKVVDGKAEPQEVEVGLRRPGFVEINSGLVTGEKIVQSGHLQLADGKKVRVVGGRETGK